MFVLLFINICCFINHNTYNILDFYYFIFIPAFIQSILVLYYIFKIYFGLHEENFDESSDNLNIWEKFQWWFLLIFAYILLYKPFQDSPIKRKIRSSVNSLNKTVVYRRALLLKPLTNIFQLFYRREKNKVLWLQIFFPLSFNTLSIKND